MTDEVKALGDAIVRTHDGKLFFNFGEISKMLRRAENCVGHDLHQAGITVKKQGSCKMVNAYDLALYMLMERIAPIDNTSRGVTRSQEDKPA